MSAKWGNEYTENTKLEDLKPAEKEAIEAEKAAEEKSDAEETERAEAEEKEKEAGVVPEKKDEEEIVDIDAIEAAEAEAAKAESEKVKTPEQLAAEKEASDKAIQEAAEAKAKEEAEAAKLKSIEAQKIEIKIGEETYDAKRATESIKKLKSIEEDEFLKNLIEHRNNGGDVLDYLKANNNNEDAMSPEELVRFSFDRDPANKGLTREELDLLWEAEKESKYPISVNKEKGIDERAAKIGLAKLNRDAASAKAAIKADKAKFKIAPPKTEIAAELVQAELNKAKDKQATAQAQSLKEWNDEVDGHNTTKNILEKGMVVLEIDGKKIGYKSPNPKELVDITKDLSKFIAKTVDETGHVKLDLFSEIMAYAQDPKKFKSDLVKYGRSLEKKAGLKDAKVIDPDRKSDAVVQNGNKEGMSATMASLKNAKWTTD